MGVDDLLLLLFFGILLVSFLVGKIAKMMRAKNGKRKNT